MKRYFFIWLRFTAGATQIAFASRFGAAIFLIGKLLRFFFFLFFIVILFTKIHLIAGYTIWEMIFFFLTFNLIDIIPQFLFRDVYRFRAQIVNGYFDFTLLKPMSPLFKSLFGGSDLLDLLTLFLMLLLLTFSIHSIGAVSLGEIFLYMLLIVNSCFIALAFHVLVLSLGVITTEVDNAMWLYRDVTQMGRFPIDIYTDPLRTVLTFAIPVGVMMTFPAKALLGLLSWPLIVVACAIGAISCILSLFVWHYALRFYSSASS